MSYLHHMWYLRSFYKLLVRRCIWAKGWEPLLLLRNHPNLPRVFFASSKYDSRDILASSPHMKQKALELFERKNWIKFHFCNSRTYGSIYSSHFGTKHCFSLFFFEKLQWHQGWANDFVRGPFKKVFDPSGYTFRQSRKENYSLMLNINRLCWEKRLSG